MPRLRMRPGSSCTSNDSWFGAAKTVTVVTIELAQERRTLLLDRAIAAVIDQTSSSRSARLPRAHGALSRSRGRSRRHGAHARPDLYARERVIQAQVRP